MQWLTDLFFPGMSWEEIMRMGELCSMGVLLLISVFAVGAVDISTRHEGDPGF